MIQMLTDLVNNLHDSIKIYVYDSLHLNVTDKDLHFWIMGIIGIVVFLLVLIVSKLIAHIRFGITILAFLYTFTFMTVFVFAIEIQQALTSRGSMEFQDAVVGLWGFIFFFFLFIAISVLFFLAKKLRRKFTNN